MPRQKADTQGFLLERRKTLDQRGTVYMPDLCICPRERLLGSVWTKSYKRRIKMIWSDSKSIGIHWRGRRFLKPQSHGEGSSNTQKLRVLSTLVTINDKNNIHGRRYQTRRESEKSSWKR